MQTYNDSCSTGFLRSRESRGAALLLCMIFTGAALTMTLVLSSHILAHVRHAEYHAQATRAFAAAEAVLHLALNDLEAGGPGRVGIAAPLQWRLDGRPALPTPGTAATAGDASWYALTGHREDWPADVRVIYGVARAGQIERRLELTVRLEAPGAWKRLSWRELTPRDGEAS